MTLASHREGSYMMKVTPSLWVKEEGICQSDKFLRKSKSSVLGIRFKIYIKYFKRDANSWM